MIRAKRMPKPTTQELGALDADFMLQLDQFFQLADAARLAESAELPKALSCTACGQFLFAITNGETLVIGSFKEDVSIDAGGVSVGTKLVMHHRPHERKVTLHCSRCGHHNSWYRSR